MNYPSDSSKELDMIVKIRMIIKETHISNEMKVGMIWEIVK